MSRLSPLTPSPFPREAPERPVGFLARRPAPPPAAAPVPPTLSPLSVATAAAVPMVATVSAAARDIIARTPGLNAKGRAAVVQLHADPDPGPVAGPASKAPAIPSPVTPPPAPVAAPSPATRPTPSPTFSPPPATAPAASAPARPRPLSPLSPLAPVAAAPLAAAVAPALPGVAAAIPAAAQAIIDRVPGLDAKGRAAVVAMNTPRPAAAPVTPVRSASYMTLDEMDASRRAGTQDPDLPLYRQQLPEDVQGPPATYYDPGRLERRFAPPPGAVPIPPARPAAVDPAQRVRDAIAEGHRRGRELDRLHAAEQDAAAAEQQAAAARPAADAAREWMAAHPGDTQGALARGHVQAVQRQGELDRLAADARAAWARADGDRTVWRAYDDDQAAFRAGLAGFTDEDERRLIDQAYRTLDPAAVAAEAEYRFAKGRAAGVRYAHVGRADPSYGFVHRNQGDPRVVRLPGVDGYLVDARMVGRTPSGGEVENVLRQAGHKATAGTAQTVRGVRATAARAAASFLDEWGFPPSEKERAAGKATASDALRDVAGDADADIRQGEQARQDFEAHYPVKTGGGRLAAGLLGDAPKLALAGATGPGGAAAIFGADAAGNQYNASTLRGEAPDEATAKAILDFAGTALVMRLAPLVGHAQARTLAGQAIASLGHGTGTMYALDVLGQGVAKAGHKGEDVDFAEPIFHSLLNAGIFAAPGLAGAAARGMPKEAPAAAGRPAPGVGARANDVRTFGDRNPPPWEPGRSVQDSAGGEEGGSSPPPGDPARTGPTLADLAALPDEHVRQLAHDAGLNPEAPRHALELALASEPAPTEASRPAPAAAPPKETTAPPSVRRPGGAARARVGSPTWESFMQEDDPIAWRVWGSEMGTGPEQARDSLRNVPAAEVGAARERLRGMYEAEAPQFARDEAGSPGNLIAYGMDPAGERSFSPRVMELQEKIARDVGLQLNGESVTPDRLRIPEPEGWAARAPAEGARAPAAERADAPAQSAPPPPRPPVTLDKGSGNFHVVRGADASPRSAFGPDGLGLKYNAKQRGWVVPASKAGAARAEVERQNAAAGPVPVIEPGAQTPANEPPQRVKGKPDRRPVKLTAPRPFTKTDVENRLIQVDREHNGEGAASLTRDADVREDAGTDMVGPAKFVFYRKLPGEVRSFLEGNAWARKMFTVTDDPTKGRGADVMGAMERRATGSYFEMAREVAMGRQTKTERALKYARTSPDPQVQLLAALHDNMPPARERGPIESVEPAKMPPGTKFELWGSEFEIVERFDEDGEGHRLLKDGDEYPVLPADALDKMPADKGSVKPGSWDDPEQAGGFLDGIADDAAPAAPAGRLPDGVAAAGGKVGLFGQPDFDAAAGGQEMFGFGAVDRAVKKERARTFSDEVERREFEPSRAGETEADARIREQYKDGEAATAPMFAGDEPALRGSDAVPPGVMDAVRRAVDGLKEIERVVEENRRVKGGHNADLIRGQYQGRADGYRATVEKFRGLAGKNGIDAGRVLGELGLPGAGDGPASGRPPAAVEPPPRTGKLDALEDWARRKLDDMGGPGLRSGVDPFADAKRVALMTTIAAAKVGRGVVRFSEFARAMVEELPELARATRRQMVELFAAARRTHNLPELTREEEFQRAFGTPEAQAPAAAGPDAAAVTEGLRALLSDPARADAAYDALPGARTPDGVLVLNGDTARELSPHYQTRADRLAFTDATYPPAAAYVADRYARELDRGANQGKTAAFLAGGASSGKSSAIGATGAGADVGLIYDSNMTGAARQARRIDAALARGWNVSLNFVYRPYRLAAANMIERANGGADPGRGGRYVPLGDRPGNLAGLHYDAAHTFIELAERYRGDPRVNVNVVDNRGGLGEARTIPLERLAEIVKTEYDSPDALRAHEPAVLDAARGRVGDDVLDAVAPVPEGSVRPARPTVLRQPEPQRAEAARPAGSGPAGEVTARATADPARFAADVFDAAASAAREGRPGEGGVSNLGDKVLIGTAYDRYARDHGPITLDEFKAKLRDGMDAGLRLVTEDLRSQGVTVAGGEAAFDRSTLKVGQSEYHYVRTDAASRPRATDVGADAAKPPGKLEQAEGWIRDQLDRMGGTGLRSGLGGLPIDPVNDPKRFALYAALGAVKIAKGAERFATWSRKVLAEVPELARATKAELVKLWAQSRRIVKMTDEQRVAYMGDAMTEGGAGRTADTVRRSVGMVKDPARVRTELDALDVKLRAEARGAAAGYRAGEASGVATGTARAENAAAAERQRREGQIVGRAIAAKAELRAKFEDAAAVGAGVRAELARVVKENLPADQAGKMLADVARADTVGKLRAGIAKARRILADVELKAALSDLEDLTGKLEVKVPRPGGADAAGAVGTALNAASEQLPGLDRAKAGRGDPEPGRALGDVRPGDVRTVDLRTLPKDVRDEVEDWLEQGRYLKDRLRNAGAGASLADKASAVAAFREIDRNVRRVVADHLAAQEIRIGERLRTRDQVARSITDTLGVDDVAAPTGSEPTAAPREGLRKVYGRKALSMDAIAANMLGEDHDAYRLSIGQVRAAQSAYLAEKRKTHEAFAAAMEAADIPAGSKRLDDWLTAREALALPDAGGLRLTRSEQLHVVATAADPETAALVARGVPWSFEAHKREAPVRLSAKDVDAIRANLRPEELALIDAFRARNDQVTPAAIMARIDLTGSAPETHRGYYPRARNRMLSEEAGLPEGWRGYVDRAMENISSMKDREADVKQPLMIKDFVEHAFGYFDDVAKLTHLAGPVRSVASVWQHPDVARAVVRKYGESMNARVAGFLRDTMMVNAAPPAAGLGLAWKWGAQQVARAWLQLNPGPMMKNIGPGTLSLLPEFDVRDWARGVARMFSPGAFRRMLAGSGVAWERYHGGIYGAYTPLAGGRAQTVADMTFGQASKAMAAAMARLEPGRAYAMAGRAVDALPFMEYADSVPLRAAWAASEAFVDRTRPGLSPDARAAAVVEKFERAVYRTQNGSSSTENSGYASEARGNPFLSAWLQFKSDSAKKYSMLALMKHADAATRAKTVLSIGVGAAMSAGIGYGLKQAATAAGAAVGGGKGRDPEQEKRMRDAAAWGAVKDVAGVAPLGGLATQIANLIATQGHPDVASNPTEQMMEGTIDGMVNVGRAVVRMSATEPGSVEYEKAHAALMRETFKAAVAGGTALGVPLVPWAKYAERGYHASQYEPPDPRLAGVERSGHSAAEARKTVPAFAAAPLAERHRLGRLPDEQLTHAERLRLLQLDQYAGQHAERVKELAAAMDAGDAEAAKRVRLDMARAARDAGKLPADERLLELKDREARADRVRASLPADLRAAMRERAHLARLAELGKNRLTAEEAARLRNLNAVESIYQARRKLLVGGKPGAMEAFQAVARKVLNRTAAVPVPAGGIGEEDGGE